MTGIINNVLMCSVEQDCRAEECYITSNIRMFFYDSCDPYYHIESSDAIVDLRVGPAHMEVFQNGQMFSMFSGQYQYRNVINENVKHLPVAFVDLHCDSINQCMYCYKPVISSCEENPWLSGLWRNCDPVSCSQYRSVSCKYNQGCHPDLKPENERYCCYWDDQICRTVDYDVPAYNCTGTPVPVITANPTVGDVIDDSVLGTLELVLISVGCLAMVVVIGVLVTNSRNKSKSKDLLINDVERENTVRNVNASYSTLN